MDPGEPGLHGPWLLELDRSGSFRVRQLPLASIRYETIEVGLEGVEEEGEVERRVVDGVRDALRAIEPEAGPLRYLNLRVRLTGRTRLHRSLGRRTWDDVTALELRMGEVRGVVERVEVATRPERQLARLAQGQDAPALLARLVLDLEAGTLADHELDLVRDAVARTEQVRGSRQYLPLGEMEDLETEVRVRSILSEQALLLLDELLADREAV
jgi:hypothetical protein